LTVIGLREWVALPDLGVAGLRAKIDTGASTSSLHATDIEPFERDGEKWVRFTAHLGTVVQLRHRRCEAPLVARKTIKSSNGQAQVRYVISTTLAQGSFRVTSLQEQNAELARQAQILTNQVAQAGNPAVIAKEARQLGMRPNPHLGFVDLKSGKIVVGKPSRAEAAINVPGYTP